MGAVSSSRVKENRWEEGLYIGQDKICPLHSFRTFCCQIRNGPKQISGLEKATASARNRSVLTWNYFRTDPVPDTEQNPDLKPDRQNRKTIQNKTTITFSSGLCFWWSWARWNHNNEFYKNMHRNIIVQQVRIKPNDERFDLSSKTNR